jgi:hypothetical protein
MEQRWLNAIEKLHYGREAGPCGFSNMEMAMMDAYMAGVARWLSYIGFVTAISCDGHGKRRNYLSLQDRTLSGSLDRLLMKLTGGTRAYRRQCLLMKTDGHFAPASRESLLDLAELLYRHKEELRMAFLAEHPGYTSARDCIDADDDLG